MPPMAEHVNAPLQQVGIKGKEAVQGVGVGWLGVTPLAASDHGQHESIVAFDDGVAERQLILPVEKPAGSSGTKHPAHLLRGSKSSSRI